MHSGAQLCRFVSIATTINFSSREQRITPLLTHLLWHLIVVCIILCVRASNVTNCTVVAWVREDRRPPSRLIACPRSITINGHYYYDVSVRLVPGLSYRIMLNATSDLCSKPSPSLPDTQCTHRDTVIFNYFFSLK